MEPKYEIDKNDSEKAPDFKSEVDAIISRPLNPGNIDNYTDGALEDLVGVVGCVTEAYKHKHTKSFESDMDTEIAAFKHFGLGDIIETLDSIVVRAQKIHEDIDDIDRRIAKAELADTVITPSVSMGGLAVKECDGSFVERGTIPKLKTIMFVLKNDFNVDINDDEQLKLHKGKVDKGSVRKHPYFSIELFKLGRSILVCDEERNNTFVFDNSVLRQQGIENGDLVEIPKPTIRQIIKNYPDFGRAVQYYQDNYVRDMINAIENPSSTKPDTKRAGKAGEYLKSKLPKAPEGYYSVNKLSEIWPVGYATIESVIEEYKNDLDALDEIKTYRYGSKDAYGYSPDQQALIHAALEYKGSFNEAPEFYRSATDLASDSDWKTHHRSVDKMAKEYHKDLEELGPMEKRQFTSNSATAYSPDHQALLYAALESEGYFNEPTEDIWTMRRMSEDFGADPKTINKVIAGHSKEVGEIMKYNFKKNGGVRKGYTSEQRAFIKPYVDEMKRKSKG